MAAIYLNDSNVLTFASTVAMEHARQFDAAALAKIAGSYSFAVTTTLCGSTTTASYDASGQLFQRVTLDSSGNTTTNRYDANNVLVAQTYLNAAAGTRQEKRFNITGQAYARQDATYDSTNHLIAMYRTYADGNRPQFSQVVHVDGSQTVETYTASGAQQVNQISTAGKLLQQQNFDAGGHLLFTDERHADGSREVQRFDPVSGDETSYSLKLADSSRVEVTYKITGQPYNAERDLRCHWTHPEHDPTLWRREPHACLFTGEPRRWVGRGGQLRHLRTADEPVGEGKRRVARQLDVRLRRHIHHAPTTQQDHFSASNIRQWSDITASDGSHTQTGYTSGAVMTSHTGVADRFTAASSGGDTFVVQPAFGQDLITNFHVNAASHDTIQIDNAIVSDFAHLQSLMSKSGADTLITVNANDAILLKGIVAASLTSDNFTFQVHDRPDVARDRRRWRVWQRTMDPERFVFLDETSATTSMTRRYGWGPRSERLVDASPEVAGRPAPSWPA